MGTGGMGTSMVSFLSAAFVSIALAADPTSDPPVPEEPPARGPSSLREHVRLAIDRQLEKLDASGEFSEAFSSLEDIFDQVIAYSADAEPFCDIAAALRTVRNLSQVASGLQRPLLRFLRKNPEVAASLAFLVKEQWESPSDVYTLLDRLRSAREKDVALQPGLAAALCVVHDGRRVKRKVNDTEVASPDPLVIFDYFVANQSKLVFKASELPPEALVNVVDTTADVREMEWALRKYSGNTNVGGLFTNVKYDYGPIAGRATWLSRKEYTLQNILTHGGVCGDQVYFASTVGKALGVPTTYCHGVEPTTGGHSWVGFLKKRGEASAWNFDIGRYPIHLGLPGKVIDPQTHRMIPESSVALSGEILHWDRTKRRFALAAMDAARRLLDLHASGRAFPPPPPLDPSVPGCLKKPREGGLSGAVAILDLGLHQFPYDPDVLLFLAGSQEIVRWIVQTKKAPAAYLTEVLRGKYPEFLLEALKTLDATFQAGEFSLADRYRLWGEVFPEFR